MQDGADQLLDWRGAEDKNRLGDRGGLVVVVTTCGRRRLGASGKLCGAGVELAEEKGVVLLAEAADDFEGDGEQRDADTAGGEGAVVLDMPRFGEEAWKRNGASVTVQGACRVVVGVGMGVLTGIDRVPVPEHLREAHWWSAKRKG